MGLIEVPNARAQSTGRKRHVSLCSTGSCSTRSNYGQPYPGRRVRARSGWWRVPRRWRLPRRRRPSGRRSRWSCSCRSRGRWVPRRGSPRLRLPGRVLSTSRIRRGGGGGRSGWCRGRGCLRSLRRLQQLLRRIRQLYLRPAVSILILRRGLAHRDNQRLAAQRPIAAALGHLHKAELEAAIALATAAEGLLPDAEGGGFLHICSSTS